MSLEGETALVTGASRGIGMAIAQALGARGAFVVGTATTEAGAERIHATALGIGERVGNAEMDLLIVNLYLLGAHEGDLSKLREYNDLRGRLGERLASIESQGVTRVFFVGPPNVKEFVNSIIEERCLKLVLVGHCNHWKNLEEYDHHSFDTTLLFDGNSEGMRRIQKATGISTDRLMPLW